jgi:hypothetical protein
MAETNGIKYLKINRLDASGDDCSPKIQIADNIRINYPDVGPVQYDILTIQQQADYYLLGIIPQPVTSSTNKILDYSVDAFKSTAGANLNNSPITFYDLVNIWTSVNGNTLGYFISSSSSPVRNSYTLGNTPNTKLIFTLSGSYINSTGGSRLLYMGITLNGGDSYIALTSASLPTAVSPSNFSLPPITLSNDLTPIEGSTLNFEFYTDNLSFIFIDDVYFKVTSSQLSSSPSPSLLNFSPEIVNFYNTDDNVLFNNATLPKYSTIYQDIDYSTGLVPTNFELLASGNADYAPIQDSNYTATGWSNSRYKGTKIWSTDFNI